MKRISLGIVLSALLVLVGCGREDDRPDVDVPAVADDVRSSLFERIDADSIYLMANLEPLPEQLSELLWASLKPMSENNDEVYGGFIDALDHPMGQALMREFMAIDSRAAFEARGLHGNGLWAVHGLSLYPIMHWQLIDVDAFTGTLDRIASDSGVELPWRGIGDEEILWIDLGDFGLALHHDDQFLTAAIVPDDMSLLRRIAGLDRPARSFSASQLRDFNRERGYTNQASGFFDFGRLIDRLLDEDDELLTAARQAADLPNLSDDPACSNELRALARVFPRISNGLTQVSGNEMAASLIIETERSLGEKLAGIADSPVRLDGDRGALFSAGIAFNLVAARDLAREIVGGWVDNPPQCALFATIGENAADWQLAVNRPIPPVVTNLQGMRLTIDSLEAGGMTGVSEATGTLAVFMRNPQMMVGMAQMFSPELAALDLRPGGDPQPLPAGLVPNMPEASGWIAMGENSIGLALGQDQKDKLRAALKPGTAGSAILHYGMDFSAYAEMLEAMMARTRSQIEEMGGQLDMPANEKIIASMGEIYDYSEFSIHLKPQGIEINSLMRLHE